MIIQRRGTELLLIRQEDHAALAAEIMSGWQADGLPDATRREAILTAAREHDEIGQRLRTQPRHHRTAGRQVLDAMTGPFEVVPDQIGDVPIVLDHENPRHVQAPAATPASRTSGAAAKASCRSSREWYGRAGIARASTWRGMARPPNGSGVIWSVMPLSIAR